MRRILLSLLLSLSLSACVTQPIIQTTKFAKPRTVAIVEAPAMRHAALIGITAGTPGLHFSSRSDHFFQLDPSLSPAMLPLSPSKDGQAAATAVTQQAINGNAPFAGGSTGLQIGTAALVGALIDASAESTQKRAASFHAEVKQRLPSLDMRSDFLAALTAALQAKGIQTVVIRDSSNTLPRLRWPAVLAGADGKALAVATTDLPAVDADLLIQYSPLAFFEAPGPLNAYTSVSTVGVAVYDGRTKEFLGYQEFMTLGSLFSKHSYHSYSGLLDNIETAVPALHMELLSQASKIANVLAKEASPP